MVISVSLPPIIFEVQKAINPAIANIPIADMTALFTAKGSQYATLLYSVINQSI
jgi:hypothetical protein